MTSSRTARVLLTIITVVCPGVAWSIPGVIHHQGFLTNGGGVPVTTLTNVVFTIYNAASGGTVKWTEVRSITPDSQGRFSILLGQATPLHDSVFKSTSLWLGTTVGADPEMTPRVQIASVAYAFRPATIDGATGGQVTGAIDILTDGTGVGSRVRDPGGNIRSSLTTSGLIINGSDNMTPVVALTQVDSSASGTIGRDNVASGEGSFAIGNGNNALGYGSFVAGKNNTASGAISTVAGGETNLASGVASAVGGGRNNSVNSDDGLVAGGLSNSVTATRAVVSGGAANSARANGATVAGGQTDTASGAFSTVGGGLTNLAKGDRSTVPGGSENSAVGNYSFAAGVLAKASHNGTVVIAANDPSGPGDSIVTGGPEQMVLRADGGFAMTTTPGTVSIPAGRFLQTSTGAYLSLGGTWTSTSDSGLKENFAQVQSDTILARIRELPIRSWNYLAEDTTVRHIGPTAQDFYLAFGVGADNKHISMVDADGVALAAIQALIEQNCDLLARLERVEKELRESKDR